MAEKKAPIKNAPTLPIIIAVEFVRLVTDGSSDADRNRKMPRIPMNKISDLNWVLR